jgi:hypothetical protein
LTHGIPKTPNDPGFRSKAEARRREIGSVLVDSKVGPSKLT